MRRPTEGETTVTTKRMKSAMPGTATETTRIGALLALAVGLTLLAAACFSEDPEPMGPDTMAPAECLQLARDAGFDPDDPGIRVVGIRGFAFVPSQVEVDAGTELVWVNCEPPNTPGGDHTSTADDGLWDSGLLDRGDTFQRVFDEAGSFGYHCIPHPFMTGTVTVGS